MDETGHEILSGRLVDTIIENLPADRIADNLQYIGIEPARRDGLPKRYGVVIAHGQRFDEVAAGPRGIGLQEYGQFLHQETTCDQAAAAWRLDRAVRRVRIRLRHAALAWAPHFWDMIIGGSDLTLQQANEAIAAAIRHALQLGIRISVAVCDEGGHPVALARMDGAGWAATYGALGKAAASAATGSRSGRIPSDLHVMGRINELSGERMIFSQGAVPIVVDATLVGAIGAGGGTAEQDELCAAAGAAVLTDA